LRFRSPAICFVVERRSRRLGPGNFLSENLFTPARVLFATPVIIFGAQFRFDLGSNPSFELSPLAGFSFLPFTLSVRSPQPCLYFCLTASLFLGLQTRGFFSLTAAFRFGAALGFLLGTSPGLFGGEPLRFLLSTPASFFLSTASHFIFFTAAGHGLGSQLSLNLGPQARFFFRLKASAKFRLPSHFLFYPATFGFFGYPLGVVLSLLARLFARMDPFNFFLDRSESHFGATA
jgi:hypothetical protein